MVNELDALIDQATRLFFARRFVNEPGDGASRYLQAWDDDDDTIPYGIDAAVEDAVRDGTELTQINCLDLLAEIRRRGHDPMIGRMRSTDRLSSIIEELTIRSIGAYMLEAYLALATEQMARRAEASH